MKILYTRGLLGKKRIQNSLIAKRCFVNLTL